MPKCYDEDVLAPRMGCSCRRCHEARERALDPGLVALVREEWGINTTFSPAREMLRRYMEMYLMGRIEWAALYPQVIEALVRQSDEAHRHLLKFTEISPSVLRMPK